MENKNTILLTIIAIATLLVAIVGATFAYFASNIDTNNNIAVNVTTSNNQAIFIASTDGNINLNVESYMMQQGDVDSNGLNTSGDSDIADNLTSSATLNVTLQASEEGHETTCSYDIVYTWDEASAKNFESQSTVEQSGGVDNNSKYYKSKYYVRTNDTPIEGYKELTVEIEQAGGTEPYPEREDYSELVAETNIDTFELKDNSNKIVLNKKKETISSQSATTKSYASYLITFRFYNLKDNQSKQMGKTFSGKISIENVVC